MPHLQPTYNQNLSVAVAGQLAEFELHNVISREAQNSAGIVFGAVVSRGTADHQCQPGGTGATNYLGIALLDPTVRAEENNQYQQYDTVAVLTKGVVWVVCAVAVTPGQAAYFDGSGNITNVVTSNTAIPGGTFDGTGAAAGLVKLRLG
jgi:hypothetical protein